MTHTQTQGADGAGTKADGRREMAAGCCSAVYPCSHQQRDPYSLCAICQKANGLTDQVMARTPAPAVTPGVPDSLRALSEAATAGPFSVSGVRKRYVENSCVIVDAPTCSGLFAFATADGRETLTALADAKFFVAAANHVRDAIAVHVSASEQAADDRREIEQLEHQLDVAKQERDAAFDRADAATRSAGTEAGWVVANAKEGAEQRFRRWGQIGPEWTADRTAALWFARRSDAEAFAAEDEDAWRVLPVTALAAQPAGQAGVPDSLRKEVTLADANAAILMDRARNGGWVDLFSLNRSEMSAAWSCLDWVRTLIAAQPAGQSAGSEIVKWGSANTVGELMAQLRTLPADAKIFGTFKGPPDKGEDYRTGVRGVLLSRERVRGRWIRTQDKEAPYEHVIWTVPEPAPNSTRTGAAETEAPWPEQYAAHADGYGPVEEWRDWTKRADREPLSDGALHALRGMVGEFMSDALAARPEAPSDAGIAVDIQRMRLSDGRTDYFVRIKCGDRETTPYVFRERYKAEHHVAHFEWLFGLRPDEPDLMAYDEASHPNDPTPPSDPAPSGQAEG